MTSDIEVYLNKAKTGFASLNLPDHYKKSALQFLTKWLTEEEYKDYVPQIKYLIDSEKWDFLLDCFHQIIPFGTGGRRGEVGIGPNRINLETIRQSAQGHAQFLIKKYGQDAKKRGVALAFDVRQFFPDLKVAQNYSQTIPNPVINISCRDMANASLEVYAANGIKTYIFDNIRTTPELSFTIRHLKTISGAIFSASHNPPEWNGIKVFDEFGGQLIPPEDELLVEEVASNVNEIKKKSFEGALKQGLAEIINPSVDTAYYQVCADLSASDKRDVNFVYTPLHGCGLTSVKPVLEKLKFKFVACPKTSNPSGHFENITFNIPNPEVVQSFDATLKYVEDKNFDLIVSSDPDADRTGVMVKHKSNWVYFNGNEIGAVLAQYAVIKAKEKGKKGGVMIKSDVTTNVVSRICEANGVEIIGNLLVGYKYIGEELNKLEKIGRIDEFLFACEESHGFSSGNYIREKDSVLAIMWLLELAAEVKPHGQSLVDYLNDIYSKYGYYRNYLTEVRLPGAQGMEQIIQIQSGLRSSPPQSFGEFKVKSVEDWLDRLPIISETDKISKNGIVFHFSPPDGFSSMRVTVRPSGTEPKIKMYFEIGTLPYALENSDEVRQKTEIVLKKLEKSFMVQCYKYLGIDFPDRGFLLFWQLPLKDKMHYFEIEPEIASLKDETNLETRKDKLAKLLDFLGAGAIEKVDGAFKEKYGQKINEFLSLN